MESNHDQTLGRKGWCMMRKIEFFRGNSGLSRHWAAFHRVFCYVEKGQIWFGKSPDDYHHKMSYFLRGATANIHHYNLQNCLVIKCVQFNGEMITEILLHPEAGDIEDWLHIIRYQIITTEKEDVEQACKAISAISEYVNNMQYLQTRIGTDDLALSSLHIGNNINDGCEVNGEIENIFDAHLELDNVIKKTSDYTRLYEDAISDIGKDPLLSKILLPVVEDDIESDDFVVISKSNQLDEPKMMSPSISKSYFSQPLPSGKAVTKKPISKNSNVIPTSKSLPVSDNIKTRAWNSKSNSPLPGHSNYKSFGCHSNVMLSNYCASFSHKDKSIWHLPVPRLRILIMAVGTRGDVQPFAVLASKLIQDGHRVRLATHAPFREFVETFGNGSIEFYPLAGDPIKLSEFMVKTHGCLFPTTADMLREIPQHMFMLHEIIESCWKACIDPDPMDRVKGDGQPRCLLHCWFQ